MANKIEYKVEQFPSHQNNIEFYLNEKGSEGWDLIDTFRFGDTVRYTFKRVKNNLLTD